MVNNDHRGRGRPSKYAPIMREIDDHFWHVLDNNQKWRTAPSQLRRRYPGWDFRCVALSNGKFSLQARRLEQ